MNFFTPNSAELGEFGLVDVHESARGGPEIHSAKAHRCVDKVKAKGHDESSAWAICTSSIGKAGVYTRGHGGSASPKRKVHEAIEAKRKQPMMDDEDTEDMPDDEAGEGENGGCDCKKCMQKRMMKEMEAVIAEEEARAVREVKKCKKGYYQTPMKEMAFSKAKAGSGGRFKACVAAKSKQKGVRDPAAVCAAIGRAKFGNKRFAALSHHEAAFSSAPAGSGGRFAACEASGKSAALCAYIGRRKFGNKGFARLSAKGRRAAESDPFDRQLPVLEVNHCHGPGKGHPCNSEGSKSDYSHWDMPVTSVTVNGREHPVHALPHYTTPYYYSKAHGGSSQHFPKLSQLKRHIAKVENRRRAQTNYSMGALNTLYRNTVVDKLILHR